jgi:hypothetical protein
MKRLIAIPLMLLMLGGNSQDNISIGLYQDFMLMVSDDEHGNTAPTLDAKFDVSLQGKQFKYYYFELRPQFEIASLSDGQYVSWQINGGWVLNKLIVNRLELGAYLTIGSIHRWKSSWATYGLMGDISYNFGRFKLSGLYQFIQRSDLKERYDTNGLQPNGYLGLKYNLKQ